MELRESTQQMVKSIIEWLSGHGLLSILDTQYGVAAANGDVEREKIRRLIKAGFVDLGQSRSQSLL